MKKKNMISKKRFKKVYVEITNVCNLKCSFCPITNRTKAFMSVKDFEKIAIQISKYTSYIYLHVKGEPLLHPDLDSILKICNKYNLKINISTNGILLSEKIGILINNDIRQINISLHSFKENNMTLLEYMQNIITASRKLIKRDCNVRYKLWDMSENKKDNNLDIIKVLEKEYKINIEDVKYEKDILLSENIYLNFQTLFEWPDEKQAKLNDKGTCYGLREQIAILVNGDVVPCCLDHEAKILLGNIFHNSLEDILKTSKATFIIEGFKSNKCVADLCKKCTYKYRLKANSKKQLT